MTVIKLTRRAGLPYAYESQISRALETCKQPERLAVCLFFYSDVAGGTSLAELEAFMRRVFPPSLETGFLPADYSDFQATVIRTPLNHESRNVRLGRLAPEKRRWISVTRGCWRNTEQGDAIALEVLRRSGIAISTTPDYSQVASKVETLRSEVRRCESALRQLEQDYADLVAWNSAS